MDQQSNNGNRGGGNNNNNNGNGNGPKNRQSLLVVLICLLGALMIWNFFGGLINGSASKEIRYDEFKTMVEEGKVEQVEVESGIVNIILKDEKRVTYSTPLIGSEDKLVEFLEENDVKYDKIPPDPTASILSTILSILIPFVLLIVGMNLIMRRMNKGGGMMGVGKSKAKAYVRNVLSATARMIIIPRTTCCWLVSSPPIINPLLITPKSREPTTEPIIFPVPPAIEVPPKTTAAITFISSPSP